MILIDFESSILDEDALLSRAGRSPIPRQAAATSRGKNEVAASNALRLLEESPDDPLFLVVGGGTLGKGMKALYERGRIVGIDIYASPLVQVLADAHQMPFPDGTFDGVVVQAVLEHVLDPNAVVAEIWRVLKPDGLVYAETPFMQQVHEGPYDFHRFTDSGHRWLFRRFDMIDAGAVAGPSLALVWCLDYFARGLSRSSVLGQRLRRLLLPLSIVDRLIPTEHQIDAASAVFFLGRKTTETLKPRDIVSYYNGAQRDSGLNGIAEA